MDGVLVGVRCRPHVGLSRSDQTSPKSISTGKRKFEFKYIFTEDSSQELVYQSIAKPIVEKALEGYNGTVLAYGQTGSGKSYTMGTQCFSNDGITQKALKTIMEHTNVEVHISVVEIYQEDIYDLLFKIPMKLSISAGVQAVNQKIEKVRSLAHANEILNFAFKQRRIGATHGNSTSSRSHMIITLSVGAPPNNRTKLSLVDLAGSEKVVEGSGRNEGVAINSGLLHLLRFVDGLSKRSGFVPFRDSKLTHLLKDSLSATNNIALIACILKENDDETEKTLEFASKFAGIEIKPIVRSQMYGTPYKAPQRFPNKTFSSTPINSFKKPLAPLNRTVSTPGSFYRKRFDETPVFKAPLLNNRRETRESTDSFNLSNASTSTTLAECRSPPTDREDVHSTLPLSTLGNNTVTMTAAKLQEMIAASVDQRVKATERRMAHLFRKQLLDISRKGNSDIWDKRVAKLQLEDSSLNDSLNLSQSSNESVLQITVVEPVSSPSALDEPDSLPTEPVRPEPKIMPRRSMRLSMAKSSGTNSSYFSEATSSPAFSTDSDSDFIISAPRRNVRVPLQQKIENLNGTYISEESIRLGKPSTHSESDGKKPAPRRSMRLSVLKRPFLDGYLTDCSETSTPDAKVARKDNFAVPQMPAPRSRVRRSMRLSTTVDKENSVQKRKSVTEKKMKSGGRTIKVENNNAELSHESKILKILQCGDTKELTKLPTVGPKTASLIINHRELYGPLDSVKDFAKIRGLTKNQAQKFFWSNSLD